MTLVDTVSYMPFPATFLYNGAEYKVAVESTASEDGWPCFTVWFTGADRQFRGVQLCPSVLRSVSLSRLTATEQHDKAWAEGEARGLFNLERLPLGAAVRYNWP